MVNNQGFHNTDYATVGAFHYARPTGQRPVELTKGKCDDVVPQTKKNSSGPTRSVYVSTEILTTL